MEDRETRGSVKADLRPDIEYEYVVHVKAMEAFANAMSRQGVPVPEQSAYVSFASPRRLDMKAYKAKGLIWSYSVIRVRKDGEVIEEG